jgi:hypothetical protein
MRDLKFPSLCEMFWNFTYRWFVLSYRRFGTTYRSYHQALSMVKQPKETSWTDFLILEDVTERLTRKFVNLLLIFSA